MYICTYVCKYIPRLAVSPTKFLVISKWNDFTEFSYTRQQEYTHFGFSN